MHIHMYTHRELGFCANSRRVSRENRCGSNRSCIYREKWYWGQCARRGWRWYATRSARVPRPRLASCSGGSASRSSRCSPGTCARTLKHTCASLLITPLDYNCHYAHLNFASRLILPTPAARRRVKGFCASLMDGNFERRASTAAVSFLAELCSVYIFWSAAQARELTLPAAVNARFSAAALLYSAKRRNYYAHNGCILLLPG